MSDRFPRLVKYLKRLKGIVLLNMAGLALGLVSVIFIALWVSHELSFDKWVKDSDRIYRVEALMDFTGEPFVWADTPAPLVESLLNDYPEIESGARIHRAYKPAIEIGNDQFTAENVFYAPGSFFDIFSIGIVEGDPRSVLDEPDALVISERISKKYFGNSDPLGQVVLLDNKEQLTVRGVIEDTPSNTHLTFDYLVSADVFMKTVSNPDTWDQYNYYNYIKLRKGSDANDLNTKLAGYLKTKKENSSGQFFLNPLKRIYLYRNPGFSSMAYPIKDKGPISRVVLFGVIGIIILLIAVINFINLTTAFSSKRSKEIGIRKVNGAKRSNLLGTLFGESVFQTMLSVIIALLASVLLLPLFNNISGKHFVIGDLFMLRSVLIYIIIALFTGLIAGLYPAVILSSYKPVKVLRNNPEDLSQGGGFRKILVVVQFVITILFVFCIIVINRQIKYMQQTDLGFDKERIIVYKPEAKYEKVRVIAEELEKVPGIEMVAIGGNIPVNMGNWSTFSEWDGNDEGKKLKFHMMQVDDKYFELLGFELVEGRNLLQGPPMGEVVVNEAAVRDMGLDNPIGVRITHSWEKRSYEIVGVVKDFHFRKLSDEIKPVFMYKSIDWWSPKLFVRLSAGADFSTVDKVSAIVKEALPDYPLNYIFLDDEINRCYDEELRMSSLINIATVFSIIISCIGLFSLTAFSIIKRQKEIGVRKVHGSGTSNLLIILNREYWILILVASAVALPAGVILISRWLDSYAYHINIKPGYFLISLLSIVIIATLTVSFHTVKASNLNPAETLRNE